MIQILQAIQILNALLALGATALPVAQKVGQVLEDAQRENRDITRAEWDAIVDDADQADIKLALAIENAPDDPPADPAA